MKCVVRKAMRRRIALPERFAQNMQTRTISFVEVFGGRTPPSVAFPSCKPGVTDLTLFETSCTPGTISRVRDMRCLSHAS
jgi:hypothetical protein